MNSVYVVSMIMIMMDWDWIDGFSVRQTRFHTLFIHKHKTITHLSISFIIGTSYESGPWEKRNMFFTFSITLCEK